MCVCVEIEVQKFEVEIVCWGGGGTLCGLDVEKK